MGARAVQRAAALPFGLCLGLLAGSGLGCAKSAASEPAPQPAASAVASARAPAPAASAPSTAAASAASHASLGPAKSFGQPIETTAMTALIDIARSPARYRGKVIATEGTVTRVCQEAGCWMAIKDDSDPTGTATVRMHGHTFFVPTTSSGKHARVQGTVVLMKNGHECDVAEALDAKLELDATGVELL